MMQTCFENIKDSRVIGRTDYELRFVLLFTVLAVLSKARSYREIEIFIEEHFKRLKRVFKLKWDHAPAHNTIRGILIGISAEELEASFRKHAQEIEKEKQQLKKGKQIKHLAFDGKAVCGSEDRGINKKFIQIISGFNVSDKIILCHYEIDEKSNEIPALQKLIQDLGLSGYFITADAMHCQKKLMK